MTDPAFPFPNVGVLVEGAPDGPRKLALWRDLLTAYADLRLDTDREAYLSHFVFPADMVTHYRAAGRSVRGYGRPCWARWVVIDIDRPSLSDAQAAARRLSATLLQRFPELDGTLPVYFSGGKGFHVYLELAHEPPPAVGFQAVCRALAEGLATAAGVAIDSSIYDVNHLIRLPNSRHPRTGLYKRRIEVEALFQLDVSAVLDLARAPPGDGLSAVGDRVSGLAAAWDEAAEQADRQATVRAAARQEAGGGDPRAPRYFLDFVRFASPEAGDDMQRHRTLFRAAAWLAEQGAPDRLIHALLTEPGRDVGLSPAEVTRTIDCGIAHARSQTNGRAAA